MRAASLAMLGATIGNVAVSIDVTQIMLALIALGGVYLNFKLHKVHTLVNSQHDELVAKLNLVKAERDAAQEQVKTVERSS
jgi:hypothetical protein